MGRYEGDVGQLGPRFGTRLSTGNEEEVSGCSIHII